MAASAHITHLPLELVQTIAALCPPDDIARLGATCRHLHRICDAFVFQAAFLYRLDDPTSNHITTKTALREVITQRLSSADAAHAKAVWTRLAAAACELPLLADELYSRLIHYESIPWDNSFPRPAPVDPRVRKIIGTLCTLTVLGYPAVNDFTITASLTGLTARLIDPDFWQAWDPNPTTRITLAAQLAFCLATGILGHRVLNNMPLLTNRIVSSFGTRSPESVVFRDLRDAGSFEGAQTAALLQIAFLPWLLRADVAVLRRGDFPRPSALPFFRRGDSIPIPLPDGIPSQPIRSTRGDDPPDPTRFLSSFACAPSWSAWLRATVDTLIDDLPRGEWVGYTTNSFARESEVAAPMRGVRFSVRPPVDNEDPDEIRISGEDGIDGQGAFRLEGTVFRLTGRVTMMKIYGGHAWCVEATLTPLGIAGTWGASARQPFGFVWMYRREWAREGC
ncbi:hypothetical protein C8A05DRAFT_17570 [Staphylotrichum tortipilum]|uniref:F-box domain-containing protein n=1 Tax=Staphylotrichum tortipilum TaxID=2831512 RepID=A0AAN6RRS0_9PEZI|nr:hypothetical protein C8A05DRAFT_17570 [Staphylotrichum longicolle]